MTLSRENVEQIDDYISTVGLSRSEYIDMCIKSDVQKLDEILKNIEGSVFETKRIVKDYFNAKRSGGSEIMEEPELWKFHGIWLSYTKIQWNSK